MKKISLFLVLVFICLSASDKQEQKSVMDLLTSKEWNMQGMNDKTYSVKYTRTEKYAYFNGQLLGIQDYYLSDTIDGAFNPKKIGLAKNGKYIICKIIGKESFSEMLMVAFRRKILIESVHSFFQPARSATVPVSFSFSGLGALNV